MPKPFNKDKGRMVTAFQRELGKETFIVKDTWGVEKSRFFLSEERQKVYRTLCEHPCITIGMAAGVMNLNPSSVRWHIGKLERGGFVSRKKVGSVWVFYPSDMLDDDEIELLACINGGTCGDLFRTIMKTPGITQSDAARELGIKVSTATRHMKNLDRMALITHIYDGRFTRYYGTEKFAHLYSGKQKRIRLFRESLLKKLRREMFSIDILRSTPQMISIKLSTGRKNTVLSIPVNPYNTFFRH